MKTRLAILACTTLLLAGFTSNTYSQDAKQKLVTKTTADWNVEIVSDDLDYPWEIEHRDGRLFITEAAGNIITIESGVQSRHRLETSTPIARVGGGGLLGMALSPDFTNNGIVYFYHTYEIASGLANKVIEARFDGVNWREARTLLEGIPGHRLYNGGRIAIGPDGLFALLDAKRAGALRVEFDLDCVFSNGHFPVVIVVVNIERRTPSRHIWRSGDDCKQSFGCMGNLEEGLALEETNGAALVGKIDGDCRRGIELDLRAALQCDSWHLVCPGDDVRLQTHRPIERKEGACR